MTVSTEATERDDIVIGGPADDTIDGGEGHDIVDGAGHIDVLKGGGGDDVVLGGSGDDVIGGGEGHDVLRGGSGDDVVVGEEGNDFIRGGSGADLVVGDDGHDDLWGDEGNDSINGGAGNDILIGGSGDDLMNGGEGEDRFVYFDEVGNDIVNGFEVEKDVIDLRLLPRAVAFDDIEIVDLADGSGVRIALEALDGSIELRGIAASDLTASNFALPDGTTTSIEIGGTTIFHPIDPFVGSDRASTMLDGAGGNRVSAKGGSDRVLGGEGDDRVDGGAGDDDVYGEEGDDILDGGIGADRLFGGEGNDSLDGGTGDDFLLGGAGDDTLTGGAGADVFAFTAQGGEDIIVDFVHGEDRIDLSGLGVAGFEDFEIETFGNTTIIDLACHGGGLLRIEGAFDPDFDALDFVFHEPAAAELQLDGI